MPKPDMLQRTIAGIEAGLQVDEIATFTLSSRGPDDDVAAVFADPALAAFDQIPVRADERIIGVVERDGARPAGPARSAMRPLDDAMLIAADTPITDFVEIIAASRTPYRLVVKGARVTGVVTRSDVMKLPVRLLAFTLVTHLERVMARVIAARRDTERCWLDRLSKGRREHLEHHRHRLQQKRLDPPLLELTAFSDKARVVERLVTPGDDFRPELDRIKLPRDQLAHLGDYAETDADVQDFVECLHNAKKWIERLIAVVTPRGDG